MKTEDLFTTLGAIFAPDFIGSMVTHSPTQEPEDVEYEDVTNNPEYK